MLAGSQKVMEGGKTLETATGKVFDGMDGIVSGMIQINTAIARIQEISQANRQSIDTLVENISKFRIE
jgi:methyl-accepting chemotaxis protein